jgi:hypothetical protein
VVSGLIAWTLRPDERHGPTARPRRLPLDAELALGANDGWLYGLGALRGSLFLAAFVHLMLAFPDGGSDRLERGR